MSGVVAFEGELNGIVREYLEFNELDRTLHTFEKECAEKGKPLGPIENKRQPNPKLQAIQKEMIHCFRDGWRAQFFSLWHTHVPESILTHDPVAQKLEFYMSIYFAIYPIKYGKEDSELNMEAFKKFLETRGSVLSQTTEFLPFYALPFVPNPKVHPSYKDLFSDKWVPDLRMRLEKFLTLALKSTPQPRLFELYKGSNKELTDSDVKSLHQTLQEAERKAISYQRRHSRLQGDYHNLIGITADLVDTLENTVQGDVVSPEYLSEICTRLFSNQVRQSIDLTRPGTAAEILRHSVMPPQGLQHSEAVATETCLDYDKIKRDLARGAVRTQGALLQAIRWKLTKSSPSERDAALAAFISNDVLGCGQSGPHRQAVMQLLNSDSELLREYMARLLNAFASLSEGRTYLAQNDSIMAELMDNLRSESQDSLTRENVLGCLQKLSLRRQLQTLMIEEDIISWLVMVLEDNDNLSDYTLEYSVALLMNLCLRTAGKRKCAENAHQVLKVLSDLLGHDNQETSGLPSDVEIIPYVNGALYSILAIPSIREEAKAMGMEEILRCFIKDGQPDMNRQIEFIIKQLNSADEPDDVESDDEEDDEDEDQDAMEADLDKNELLKPQAGELYGDRLLNTHYIKSASPTRKKKSIDAVMNDEPLMRPVTPSQRRGTDSPVVHIQPRSRPPTAPNSRPTSRHNYRPPTRSGSRPNSAQETPRSPPPVPTDFYATNIISKATGGSKALAKASDTKNLKPASRALDGSGPGIEEYQAAFSSRPRVPRTPDVSNGRPSSRGSPPTPKYSETLPTSRPNSGGARPSSAGKKSPTPPSSRQVASKGASRGKPR